MLENDVNAETVIAIAGHLDRKMLDEQRPATKSWTCWSFRCDPYRRTIRSNLMPFHFDATSLEEGK